MVINCNTDKNNVFLSIPGDRTVRRISWYCVQRDVWPIQSQTLQYLKSQWSHVVETSRAPLAHSTALWIQDGDHNVARLRCHQPHRDALPTIQRSCNISATTWEFDQVDFGRWKGKQLKPKGVMFNCLLEVRLLVFCFKSLLKTHLFKLAFNVWHVCLISICCVPFFARSKEWCLQLCTGKNQTRPVTCSAQTTSRQWAKPWWR